MLTAEEKLIIQAAAAIDSSFVTDIERNVGADVGVTPCQMTFSFSPAGSGTVAIVPLSPTDPPNGPYYVNEIMTLTVTPATGYHFDHWVDQYGFQYVQNPWQMAPSGDTFLTAIMTGGPPPTLNVTAVASPTNGGSVSISPGPYHSNDNVTFTAHANAGWVLDHWYFAGVNEPDNGTGIITITIYSDITVTAVFVQTTPPPTTYTVSIAASPSAGGTAAISPVGPYLAGTAVRLTATAKTGYQFDHWVIDGVTYITEIVDTSTPAHNSIATAYFVTSQYLQLTVLVNNSSYGGFTQSSMGPFIAGDHVTLTAIPKTGYRFAYWLINGQESTAAVTEVVMEANGTAEAFFVAGTPSVKIQNKAVKNGDSLVFTVGGFTPNSTLTFDIVGYGYSTSTSNDLGGGTYSLAVTEPNADYTLKVTDDAGVTASDTFTVGAGSKSLSTGVVTAIVAGSALLVASVLAFTGKKKVRRK